LFLSVDDLGSSVILAVTSSFPAVIIFTPITRSLLIIFSSFHP
jgi:hypothetical protein